MLERLMKVGEQAELFEIQSESTEIRFDANKLKSFEVQETQGLAARAVVDGQLGFAASSDVTATDQLIANVLASARLGDEVPLQFPGPQPGPEVEVYDGDLAALSTSRLIEMGEEIIETVLEADEAATVMVNLTRRVRESTLRNSAGAEVVVRKAPLSILVGVERVRGDDVVIIYEYYSTAVLDEHYRAFSHRIADKLRLTRQSASLASGQMPVLFSPTGAPMLGLPLVQGLNGKNGYRGISPMVRREGERIFDEKLSVLDDPTLDGRPGSSSHDDEGVPRQRNTLIDQGRLTGFVYDLQTAALAGTKPTGNGERSLFSPPAPSFSNMVVTAGETPVDEIIAGIDHGLLVETPLGLGQGNVISGAFSNNLSLAFRIEGGEISGRVKDVSVAGNIYYDLKDIAAVSVESEWVYGGVRLPYILLDRLNVVTRG